MFRGISGRAMTVRREQDESRSEIASRSHVDCEMDG